MNTNEFQSFINLLHAKCAENGIELSIVRHSTEFWVKDGPHHQNDNNRLHAQNYFFTMSCKNPLSDKALNAPIRHKGFIREYWPTIFINVWHSPGYMSITRVNHRYEGPVNLLEKLSYYKNFDKFIRSIFTKCNAPWLKEHKNSIYHYEFDFDMPNQFGKQINITHPYNINKC